MADIIVRIPKRQLNNFLHDKLSSGTAFWRFSKRPRKLTSRNYIFFTRPEGVVFAGRVQTIVKGDDLVDEIGLGFVGTSGNFNAIWRGDETREFKPPVSAINYSQQGYRYLTVGEQRRLRKRLKMQPVKGKLI